MDKIHAGEEVSALAKLGEQGELPEREALGDKVIQHHAQTPHV